MEEGRNECFSFEKLMMKKCKADKNLIQKLATVFLMRGWGRGKIWIKTGIKGKRGKIR
jgi:hypothetical protein